MIVQVPVRRAARDRAAPAIALEDAVLAAGCVDPSRPRPRRRDRTSTRWRRPRTGGARSHVRPGGGWSRRRRGTGAPRRGARRRRSARSRAPRLALGRFRVPALRTRLPVRVQICSEQVGLDSAQRAVDVVLEPAHRYLHGVLDPPGSGAPGSAEHENRGGSPGPAPRRGARCETRRAARGNLPPHARCAAAPGPCAARVPRRSGGTMASSGASSASSRCSWATARRRRASSSKASAISRSASSGATRSPHGLRTGLPRRARALRRHPVLHTGFPRRVQARPRTSLGLPGRRCTVRGARSAQDAPPSPAESAVARLALQRRAHRQRRERLGGDRLHARPDRERLARHAPRERAGRVELGAHARRAAHHHADLVGRVTPVFVRLEAAAFQRAAVHRPYGVLELAHAHASGRRRSSALHPRAWPRVR